MPNKRGRPDQELPDSSQRDAFYRALRDPRDLPADDSTTQDAPADDSTGDWDSSYRLRRALGS